MRSGAVLSWVLCMYCVCVCERERERERETWLVSLLVACPRLPAKWQCAPCLLAHLQTGSVAPLDAIKDLKQRTRHAKLTEAGLHTHVYRDLAVWGNDAHGSEQLVRLANNRRMRLLPFTDLFERLVELGYLATDHRRTIDRVSRVRLQREPHLGQ